MKRIIGIVLIVFGSIVEVAVVWGLVIGANRIGAFVMLIVGVLLLLLGKKLAKSN